MDKKKWAIFVLIMIILTFGVFITNKIFTNGKKDDIKTETEDSSSSVSENASDEELMEIINSLDGQESESDIEHNLTMTIISPEGETFTARQARMYNALIEGNGKYSNKVKCHWDFYLNENNEETLYETMDNEGMLSGESSEVCKFTSTFIESRGDLRVVLTATISDYVEGDLETVTAERTYIVL